MRGIFSSAARELALELGRQASSTFPSPVLFLLDIKNSLALAEVLSHDNEGLAAWREGEIARHKERFASNIAILPSGEVLSIQQDNRTYDEEFTLPEIHHLTIADVEADHPLFEAPEKQSERFGTSITLTVYRPFGEWFQTLRQELDSRCGERPKDLVAALFGSIGGSSDCGHLELVKLPSKEEAERVFKMMEDKGGVIKTEVEGKEVAEVCGVRELSFKELVVLERLPGRWWEGARAVLAGRVELTNTHSASRPAR